MKKYVLIGAIVILAAFALIISTGCEPFDYAIKASASIGGTITPSGTVIVAKGGQQTFTMSSNEGYILKEVVVDNNSVGAVAVYTFTNVTAGHTIHVVFEASTPPQGTNVKDYGAKGDGITNDTQAIQNAINSIPTTGGTLYFPTGTYIVKASAAHTDTILKITQKNLTICGAGQSSATIKVADNCPSYKALFFGGTVAGGVDVSGLKVYDITFDQNVQNIDISEIMSGYPQITLGAWLGQNIYVHDVTAKNNNSVNGIMFNNNAMGVKNVTIERVTSRNIGVKAVPSGFDLSFIYFEGDGAIIKDCDLQAGDAPHAPGAVCGIEVHGTNYTVENNKITNFNLGMNVTGVGATLTKNAIINNNIITGCNWGVTIWSMASGSKIYGFDGLAITNNNISILAASSDATPTGNLRSGIGFNSSNLSVNHMTIEGNNITAPLENAVPNGALNVSHAIGSIMSGLTIYNSSIKNNTVTNFPESAIRLDCGLSTVLITNNTFTNCGSTLSYLKDSPAVVTPISINGGSISGLTISQNSFIDNLSSLRNKYWIYAIASSSTEFKIIDNTFEATVAKTRQIQLVNNIAQPLIIGIINGFIPPTAQVNSASRVLDGNYTWTVPDGFHWIKN